jgi:hypothetical protein
VGGREKRKEKRKRGEREQRERVKKIEKRRYFGSCEKNKYIKK